MAMDADVIVIGAGPAGLTAAFELMKAGHRSTVIEADEIVGGISNAKVPEGLDQNSSARFLGLYARGLVSAMPRLGAVRVLRQWAGCYDITPDANPILGFVDEVEGFFVMAGFMGHGFMMAPVIGKLCAEHLVEQKDDEVFRRWNLRRFARGELLTESMILG